MSSVVLTVGGMTCASCAARVEKKLNRIDGVTAAVNYATEQATVSFPDSVRPEDLVAAVEATGYTATLPTAEPDEDRAGSRTRPWRGASGCSRQRR